MNHTYATGTSSPDFRDSLNTASISWDQKSAPESVPQTTDLGRMTGDDGEEKQGDCRCISSLFSVFSSLDLRNSDRGGHIAREHRRNES